MNHANDTTELDSLLAQLSTLAAVPLEQATAMPPAVYTSQSLAELEQKNLFETQWLCAGLAREVSEPGDYLTFHIGRQPIVIVRQADQSLAAFANVCRHRMMQLLEGRGSCSGNRIRCPYHAWTYAVNGRLIGAPEMDKRPGFDKSRFSLIDVRLEVWEGWIYVTLNPDLDSVTSLLATLQPKVSQYRLSEYIPIAHKDHVWDTNWKLLTENFMEGYHLPVAHKATVGANFPVEETRFDPGEPNPAYTYQYFIKPETAQLGSAHPDNKHLTGVERQTSLMPTVFPSHMYVLAPDHVWYLSLQPEGVGQVRIRFGAALAPEVIAAAEDPDKLIADIVDFLAKVNEEDRFVVEGIFAGGKAPLSRPGPLCWLERENHEFTQYLARRLCADSP